MNAQNAAPPVPPLPPALPPAAARFEVRSGIAINECWHISTASPKSFMCPELIAALLSARNKALFTIAALSFSGLVQVFIFPLKLQGCVIERCHGVHLRRNSSTDAVGLQRKRSWGGRGFELAISRLVLSSNP